MSELLLDAAGRPPAMLSHFHAGPPPRNKGLRYPAALPTSRRSSLSCGLPARSLRNGPSYSARRPSASAGRSSV
jgi:hypothetical protein